MWVPPGKSANHNLWRYDVAQKSFLPPGVPGKPAGIQVEMPQGYQGSEPRGFHMMASPAGTQAPIEHINYTPETGEVSGRGVQAPSDKLNYTLMPEEAMRAQQQPSMGMGAGAAVPSGNAFGTPGQQFAGTPPLTNSPSLMGPSPTTNAAAPTWGGGGTSFESRMGMGADDPTDLMTGTDPTTSSQTTTGTDAPQGTAGPGQTDTSGVPLNESGQPAKTGDVVKTITGKDGKAVVYMIYQDQDPLYGVPRYRWQTGTSADKSIQTHVREDGRIDVIDPNQTDPEKMVTIKGTEDPNLVKKAQNDQAVQALDLQIKQADLNLKNAQNQTAVQEAQLKLQQLLAQADAARSDADKAAIEAGLAGKAKPPTPEAQIVDKTGQVFQYNPDTDHYDPTGIFKSAGAWQQYNDPATQTVRLYNPDTKEDVELAPMDPYKEYAPQKAAGGKWIQWDPAQKTFKTVYTESPDYATQWSGDELIAVNKNNPSDVRPIWQKKQTMAEKDIHDTAIDNHNMALLNLEKTRQDLSTGKITAAQARVSMEVSLQDLLHPKPQMMGQGSVYLPPGLDLNIEDTDPFTGKTSNRHASGGPADPRVTQLLGEIDGYLGNAPGTTSPTAAAASGLGTTPSGSATTSSQTVAQGGAAGATDTTPDVRSQTAQTSAGSTADAAGQFMTGYPGSDPRLTGGTQPGTQRTTAKGDIAIYDAQGNLTGLKSAGSQMAPAEGDQTEEGQQQTDQTQPTDQQQDSFFDEKGRMRRNVGQFGGGQEMGAGMAGGGVGWAPRPGAFAPATGPGFLGAGAEPKQQYNDDGNPIFDKGHAPGIDVLPTPGHTPGIQLPMGPNITTPGIQLPGGHAPGPNVKLPSVTDQGANWIPQLSGLVASKVNESLKQLLGWPKLEETPPSGGPPIGMQGGHDQPEVDPYDIANKPKQPFPPEEASDLKREPWIKDYSHLIGEGGTKPADWVDQEQEGMVTGTGPNADPGAQQEITDTRNRLDTTGVGQEAPGTMGASGGTAPPSQTPPQGPGGEQPPQWLLTLLRAHPELLHQAGLGPQPAGGAVPSTPPPSAGWQPPTPTPPAGGPPTPTPAPPPSGPPPGGPPPAAGAPPTPAGTPPPSSGGVAAPSPEGGPMTPPVDPSDVAGIGHRFGQDMNVGEPQHSGVDLQAPEGTSTLSPVDGFVQQVDNNPQGLGITVTIRGQDGSEHRLGHLKSTDAYPGQQVKMGQDLGSPVGDTGMTTGAHLHWGVKDQQGQPADPTAALGPMANLPPVPGTQMMGPPGGVGGAAQAGAPQAPMGGGNVGWKPRPGAGQGPEDLADTEPYQIQDPLMQDRFQSLAGGYQPWGSQANKLGRTRLMRPIDITPGATGAGQGEDDAGNGISQFLQTQPGKGKTPPQARMPQQQQPPQGQQTPALAGVPGSSQQVGAGAAQGDSTMAQLWNYLNQEWQRMYTFRQSPGGQTMQQFGASAPPGGGGSAGGQMSAQQQQQPQSFGSSGAPPMRQSAPPQQQQAAPQQSQSAGWTPQ